MATITRFMVFRECSKALLICIVNVNGVQYEKRYCTCGSVTTTTTVVVAASAAAPTAATTTTAATVATASPATTATTATTTTTTATTTTAATTTTQTILVLLHEKQPVVPGTKRRRTEPNVFQQANKRTTTHLKMNGVLIMEYLVKVSKRRAFWSLNEDILKITILKTNTPYPSRKIRRICSYTHQRPQGIKLNTSYPKDQYAVLELWNQYNILEDIKRGPYSKKSDTPRQLNTAYPLPSDMAYPLPSDMAMILSERKEKLKKSLTERLRCKQKCFPGDNPDCYLILSSLSSQTSIRRIRSIPYNGKPFLSTARAKIDVYKRMITLRVGEENIIIKSVKLIRRPREKNINEYWWRIYKSGNFKVLES
ncbi:hypothetical protein Tco_0725317 [Tanacetum coccineum]|uniref:Uncharacterized protein n=1 Tax=Tanacetum coccineum TaxID=301880 RepID=A0ABQ4YEP9_9ASTR